MALELKTKHRIVGLIVIIALAVIFIPLFFSHKQTNTSERAKLSAHVPNPSGRPEIQLTIPKIAASNPPSTNVQQQMPLQTQDLVNPTETVVTLPETAPVATVKQTEISQKPEVVTKAHPEHKAEEIKKHFFILEKPAFLSKLHHVAKVKQAVLAQAWTIQLGSFADKNNAVQLVKHLRSKGFTAYINLTKDNSGVVITRVFVGPELQREKAEDAAKRLEQLFHLQGVVVKYKI